MLVEILISIVIVLLIAVLVFQWRLMTAMKHEDDAPVVQTLEKLERRFGEEAAQSRKETGEQAAQSRRESSEASQRTREELAKTLKATGDSTIKQLNEMNDAFVRAGKISRDESRETLNKFNEQMVKSLNEVKTTVENQLKALQEDNAKKLEKMRETVDEKLQGTLEKRLGEQFKQVLEALNHVHKGLGEMRSLATNVGDLKKVMTNIKTRGTWGEIQLGAMLEQVMTPEQYEKNVKPKPNSNSIVEFAIKLPGQDDSDKPVWLPIDAKFPQEDYQRLVEAHDSGDAGLVESATRALVVRIRDSAKDIQQKYVEPPHTTDFAILYLPTEGLYAEVIRQPGLVDVLQRENRIVVAGPTTLLAILNSLQMGFQTLAIQQKSSEIWKVLGAVKSEFGKFGNVIAKVKKKLQEASNVVDEAARRTRVMDRKLKNVESLDEINAPLRIEINDEVGGESPALNAGPEEEED